MISYITIGTNDLEKASVFYDAVLAPLGAKRGPETERYRSWRGPNRGPMLMVMKPFNGQPATGGNGTMIAFAAESPEVVDAMYKAALAAGGTDEGEPGERRPGLYVGYFRDLDGNKLDAICM